ncbi:MAG: polysaccharide deacetylase family protein [Pirellulales bacterium]|nr:polysaccharide deacetylase family protein [Pirellulales bacterium]
MNETGLNSTLFVLPSDAEAYPELLRELAKERFEIGLHYHPHEEGHDEFCGAYSYENQVAMYDMAIRRFTDAVGFRPTSFRTGSFSANDMTFPAVAQVGFRCCSSSLPERRMTKFRANWSGAVPHVHFAHSSNRLLEGDLDLVEVPVTGDPDSMLWSGLHPQDLRVELFDAKNQFFLIDKMLVREKARAAKVRAIVTLTHNIFEYGRVDDFRHVTMKQMIADFQSLARKHEVRLVPATIGQIADAYRASSI